MSRYKLKYKIDIFNDLKGYSKEDQDYDEGKDGLTDSLILGSILHEPDGAVSHMFVTIDENKQPIKAHDYFMAWASLTHSLIDYPNMNKAHKLILSNTQAAIRNFILSAREISEYDKNLDTNPSFIKGKFIIDDFGQILPATSLSEWGEWFGDPAEKFKRVVSHTKVTEGLYVSTVFLGMDHGFPELFELEGKAATEYKPTLWETMVFGDESHDICERYTSIDDAVKGHLDIVDQIRATLK